MKKTVAQCQANAGFGQSINSTEYSSLFRKELTSSIVNILITDIGLVSVTDSQSKKTKTSWDKELGFENYSELANGLKMIPHIYRRNTGWQILQANIKGTKMKKVYKQD